MKKSGGWKRREKTRRDLSLMGSGRVRFGGRSVVGFWVLQQNLVLQGMALLIVIGQLQPELSTQLAMYSTEVQPL